MLLCQGSRVFQCFTISCLVSLTYSINALCLLSHYKPSELTVVQIEPQALIL